MPDKYFDKFPTIKYSNNNVVDITKRVAILEKVSTDPFAFYPYEITSNERADQLSTRYYEDPYKSWILYLGNKIVDPYYEWYMHTEEFDEYIIMKYGSVAKAADKIKFYRNNWSNVQDISVSSWDALTIGMKNYWEPKFGVNNRIIGYKRKQVDWKAVTNKIVSYSYKTTKKKFIRNEIVNIVFDKNNIGQGQVISAANNVLFLQHMSGTFFTSDTVGITPTSYVYGTESTVNTIFTAVTSISNNIVEEELSYYAPVSYLDHENEKNEFNKSVRVIDSNLKQTMVNNLKDLMRE